MYPRVKYNVLKIFQLAICVIADLSIHPLFHNVANKHDDAPIVGTMEQFNQAWNSLAKCLVSSPTYPKNLWKSVHPFLRFVASKHGSRKKIDPGPKWYKHIKRLLIVPCLISKFHENPFNRYSRMFAICASFHENTGDKILCSSGLM